jgi:hypothetical protein
MAGDPYRVFVSHGSHDLWIAAQMARCVRETGAETFLHATDVEYGANYKERLREELARCNELIVLITPWSRIRSWIWSELGGAWVRGVPIVPVFFGLTPEDLEKSGQGKAMLDDVNVVELNAFDDYVGQLRARIQRIS